MKGDDAKIQCQRVTLASISHTLHSVYNNVNYGQVD